MKPPMNTNIRRTSHTNKKSTEQVLVLRRSCLTGRIVWLYRGASKRAAATAYYRACIKELHDHKHRNHQQAERQRNIMHILNECIADLDPTLPLTKEQQQSARLLRKLAEEPISTSNDFYEHVVEERRRRAEDREIRRQMHLRIRIN